MYHINDECGFTTGKCQPSRKHLKRRTANPSSHGSESAMSTFCFLFIMLFRLCGRLLPIRFRRTTVKVLVVIKHENISVTVSFLTCHMSCCSISVAAMILSMVLFIKLVALGKSRGSLFDMDVYKNIAVCFSAFYKWTGSVFFISTVSVSTSFILRQEAV